LTKREAEVISLAATGVKNDRIAVLLGISELTVQVHMKNIFSKLNVTDRTSAAYVAARLGIIRSSD